MESNFYHDEFEELIKQKADQYKLYPSDKVWKRIYSSLHTRRRWFIAGMALLITGFFFLAGNGLLVPDKHASAIKKPITSLPSTDLATDAEKDNSVKLPIAPNFSTFNNDNGSMSRAGNPTASADVPVKMSDLASIDNPVGSISPNGGQETGADEIPGRINAYTNSTDKPLIIDNYPLVSRATVAASIAQPDLSEDAQSKHKIAREEMKKLNWMKETASFAIPKIKAKSRFELQEYLSPTASFRTLSGGGNYETPSSNVQNIPIALTHLGSPNDYVDHKPAMGFEFGAALLYRLSRNVSLKTGLQFNYSRYMIEAYSSYVPHPATITLNSVFGYLPNSITGYTNVQNFGGNANEALQNQYFDFSSPIGLEVKVVGNGRLQFSLAGTVEPTYLLNRNSYLLATDYSNYVKDPTLFRRWNFTGAIEAFASYQVGGIRLQLGPQFRYQFLSSFVGAYPIRENLKAYGLKIGVTRSIW
ncbi:MAG TPA: hypothetical protein VKR32_11360 [Puia sp.]|nr:hypothetical protein [Puia sp.]